MNVKLYEYQHQEDLSQFGEPLRGLLSTGNRGLVSSLSVPSNFTTLLVLWTVRVTTSVGFKFQYQGVGSTQYMCQESVTTGGNLINFSIAYRTPTRQLTGASPRREDPTTLKR